MKNNLPFQAIDIEDHSGFKAALYAVNALYKRCGMECTDDKKARKSVSKIVQRASLENICLLLRDWYSTNVDDLQMQKILSELPEQISDDDATRYGNSSVVNGIEWSAIATIFRCNIAVKIVSDSQDKQPGLRRNAVEWKVAVPSPGIFGLSSKTNNGPATACVFLLSHQAQTRNYYPLLPSNQFVFEPGKPLSLKSEEVISSGSSQEASSGEGDKVLLEVAGPSQTLATRSSSKLSQKRKNEKKKQVQFLDEKKTQRENTRKPVDTASMNEKYTSARRLNSNLSTLTSRGTHRAPVWQTSLKDNENSTRSKVYKKVEKTRKGHISELSESSIHLNEVYQEARRNEREISCIEIYDRIYHNDINERGVTRGIYGDKK